LTSTRSDYFTAEHGLKQFGVFAVCQTVQRVPRIVFAYRTIFRRNAQFDVEVGYPIEGFAADVLAALEPSADIRD
jgi:hypothetical protein